MATKSLRCTMRVSQASRSGGVDADTAELYEVRGEKLLLEPVGDAHDWAPPAQLIVQIDDKAHVGPFEVGDEFNLDLTPVG